MATLLTSAAVVVAALTLAPPLRGQRVQYAGATAPVVVVASSKADQLSDAAVRLEATASGHRRLMKAARLHQESAALRLPGDPRADRSLLSAGLSFYYAGDLPQARGMMEQGAFQALARGDVLTAVNAEIDAALIAQEEGKVAERNRLGDMAKILATSSVLSFDERAAVLSRIDDQRRTKGAAPSKQ